MLAQVHDELLVAFEPTGLDLAGLADGQVMLVDGNLQNSTELPVRFRLVGKVTDQTTATAIGDAVNTALAEAGWALRAARIIMPQ
jgi:hypothetical protein